MRERHQAQAQCQPRDAQAGLVTFCPITCSWLRGEAGNRDCLHLPDAGAAGDQHCPVLLWQVPSMGADQAGGQDEMQICLCPGGTEHGEEEGLLPKQQSSALHGNSVSLQGFGEEGLRTLPGRHLLSFVTLSSQATTHLLPHLGTAAVPFLCRPHCQFRASQPQHLQSGNIQSQTPESPAWLSPSSMALRRDNHWANSETMVAEKAPETAQKAPQNQACASPSATKESFCSSELGDPTLISQSCPVSFPFTISFGKDC